MKFITVYLIHIIKLFRLPVIFSEHPNIYCSEGDFFDVVFVFGNRVHWRLLWCSCVKVKNRTKKERVR